MRRRIIERLHKTGDERTPVGTKEYILQVYSAKMWQDDVGNDRKHMKSLFFLLLGLVLGIIFADQYKCYNDHFRLIDGHELTVCMQDLAQTTMPAREIRPECIRRSTEQ